MISTGTNDFFSAKPITDISAAAVPYNGGAEKDNGFAAELQQQCRDEKRPASAVKDKESEPESSNPMAELAAASGHPGQTETAAAQPDQPVSAAPADKGGTAAQPAKENKDPNTAAPAENTGTRAGTARAAAASTQGRNVAKNDSDKNTTAQTEHSHTAANAKSAVKDLQTIAASQDGREAAAGVKTAAANAKSASATAASTTRTATGQVNVSTTTAGNVAAADLKVKLSNDTGAKIHNVTLTTAAETAKSGSTAAAKDRTAAGRDADTAAKTAAKTETSVATAGDKNRNLLQQLDQGARRTSLRLNQNGDDAENVTVKGQQNATRTEVTVKGKARENATAKTVTATADTSLRAQSLLQGFTERNAGTITLQTQISPAAYAQLTERVNALEQIMEKVRENLPIPAAAAAAGSGIKIDFEAGSLGRVQMQMQQQGDSINIVIDPSSDSSRQQLMDQRQELAQMLRNLGYREMSLNIADQRNQPNFQQQQQQNSASSGNELQENVKLAGDDRNDLLQILNMS